MVQTFLFDRFTVTFSKASIAIENTAPVLLSPPSDITIPVGSKVTIELGEVEDGEGDKVSVSD